MIVSVPLYAAQFVGGVPPVSPPLLSAALGPVLSTVKLFAATVFCSCSEVVELAEFLTMTEPLPLFNVRLPVPAWMVVALVVKFEPRVTPWTVVASLPIAIVWAKAPVPMFMVLAAVEPMAIVPLVPDCIDTAPEPVPPCRVRVLALAIEPMPIRLVPEPVGAVLPIFMVLPPATVVAPVPY